MRIALVILTTVIVLALGAAAAVLAWNEPEVPPPMLSVANALDAVDFGDLPAKQTFTARDGTKLVYRGYPGNSADTVVLIHGVTFTSASMHAVARALHGRGATVYSLSLRGHDGTGRSGDIDYVGQLDDDLEDFMKGLGPRRPGERRALLGFSAGGGFVLRFAGGARAKMFDRFVLVSPALFYSAAPMQRPKFGGWTSVAWPRVMLLLTFSRLSIHAFDGLPVIVNAVPSDSRYSKTRTYTYRMSLNFGAGEDYLDALRRAPGSVALLAGAADEVFIADKYAPLLQPVRPDMNIEILPGLGHMDMIVKPEALAALADKTLGPAQ